MPAGHCALALLLLPSQGSVLIPAPRPRPTQTELLGEQHVCCPVHFCLVEGFVFCFEHLLVDSVPEHTVLPYLTLVPLQPRWWARLQTGSYGLVLDHIPITQAHFLSCHPTISAPQLSVLPFQPFLGWKPGSIWQVLCGKDMRMLEVRTRKTSGSGPVLGWLGYTHWKRCQILLRCSLLCPWQMLWLIIEESPAVGPQDWDYKLYPGVDRRVTYF